MGALASSWMMALPRRYGKPASFSNRCRTAALSPLRPLFYRGMHLFCERPLVYTLRRGAQDIAACTANRTW